MLFLTLFSNWNGKQLICQINHSYQVPEILSARKMWLAQQLQSRLLLGWVWSSVISCLQIGKLNRGVIVTTHFPAHFSDGTNLYHSPLPSPECNIGFDLLSCWEWAVWQGTILKASTWPYPPGIVFTPQARAHMGLVPLPSVSLSIAYSDRWICRPRESALSQTLAKTPLFIWSPCPHI